MRSEFGPYPMTRNGSGTSWLPDATPMNGLHFSARRLAAHGARLRQRHLRPPDRAAGRRQGLHREHGDADGESPARPRDARPARDALARSDDGQERLSAARTDRRDGRRRRRRWSIASIRTTSSWSSPRRTASRSASSGAAFAYFGLPGEPALGPSAFMHRFSAHAQSGGSADAPLARFDAHRLRRRDARRQPRPVAARRLVVQRPRARPLSLEHRDAQVRFMVDPALVQPGCPSSRCR